MKISDILKKLKEKEKENLVRAKMEIKDTESFRKEAIQNIRSQLEEMNDRFERFGDKKSIEYQEFRKAFEEGNFKEKQREIEGLSNEIGKIVDKAEKGNKLSDEEIDIYKKLNHNLNIISNEQTEGLVRTAQILPAPKTWVGIDKFAQEKVSSTIAEVALDTYKKYKDKSPVISMENVYPEFPLSRADTLRDTIKESRKKFAEKLVEEGKMSKTRAEKTAEKLIGVTWDVGHIYLLRKSGYSDEDIREEAKKIAPYVKHAHLTDNFGFEDSHLPPGMGDVNIKEQMRELEKAGFKGKGIVEAGEFVANFKEAPHIYALEHMGSSLYPDKVAPFWDEIAETSGNYFVGYGEMMPQKYFDLYGAPGFSQLPATLGGSGATGSGGRGRFAAGGGDEEEAAQAA